MDFEEWKAKDRKMIKKRVCLCKRERTRKTRSKNWRFRCNFRLLWMMMSNVALLPSQAIGKMANGRREKTGKGLRKSESVLGALIKNAP